MPLQSTSGAASYDAFGGGVAAVPKYIEDYFSTFLFTGNASTQTITNGIDLSTKGGLVWTKNRTNAYDNYLYDTARGVNKVLLSNNTIDQQSLANTLTAFNSNGFTLGNSDYGNITNGAAAVSWSWAKAPKFFDVVTYTGNGASSQAITHNLGSTPGCVIVKRTDSTSFWLVWHRGFSSPDVSYGYLNSTDPFQPDSPNNNWAAAPTSTTFTPAANYNVNGATYVAYLFAHNAGGFGLTGTDNVISCGSYTSNGSTISVNLGWEPQWILIKRTSNTGNWNVTDNMRGMTAATANASAPLFPNLSDAELAASSTNGPAINATGFTVPYSSSAFNYPSGETYIYIAIRRGPMKVPTSGTSVFEPKTVNNNSVLGGLMAADMGWFKDRATTSNWFVSDRLRGITGAAASYYNPTIYTNLTNAEATPSSGDTVASTSYGGTGVTNGNIYFGGAGLSTDQALGYSFKRAPSFFDEVCYTGNGTDPRNITHNLTVSPELVIIKARSRIDDWVVRSSAFPAGVNGIAYLNLTDAATNGGYSYVPTTTTFQIGGNFNQNQSGQTYVAYLFATCAGVSKVGSYTGTGTTLQINCGFTAGSRFVLIKRTDSTGDWYVWDSARGIVSGNDPYLLLNSTAAEVTSTDYIDTYSAGFELSSTAPAAINASGGTFIFLAIA